MVGVSCTMRPGCEFGVRACKYVGVVNDFSHKKQLLPTMQNAGACHETHSTEESVVS